MYQDALLQTTAASAPDPQSAPRASLLCHCIPMMKWHCLVLAAVCWVLSLLHQEANAQAGGDLTPRLQAQLAKTPVPGQGLVAALLQIDAATGNTSLLATGAVSAAIGTAFIRRQSYRVHQCLPWLWCRRGAGRGRPPIMMTGARNNNPAPSMAHPHALRYSAYQRPHRAA